MQVLHSPPVLLLVTGLFLGTIFPLGKLARAAGISPLVWALLIAAGVTLCLVCTRALQGKGLRMRPEYLKFYLYSSVVSLVIPNVLIFVVIPHLGSGFAGLLFTLSPIFTLVLAVLLQVRVPGKLGAVGIAVGFVGAIMIAWTRGEISQPASWSWVLLGMCIPASLAIGNLYRTIAWPADAEPLELATGSNAAAAMILCLLMPFVPGTHAITRLFEVPLLAGVQVLAASLMFSTYYRLQLVGGPTYLSQISYVAAAVALLVGTLLLDERYASITWAGGVLIMIGIAMTILAQRQQN